MTNLKSIPLSFEFFPPKTDEGFINMGEARSKLAALLNVEFFSVTYGAGGSTQEKSWAAVQAVQAAGSDVAPHLSCIGATKDSIRRQLHQYQQAGIRRIVALRGDLPSGYGMGGEFKYAADLVAFIRAETADWFTIYTAAYPEYHPQAKNAQKDLDAFIAKIQTGGTKTAAITQYFFNSDAYFHFVDVLQKRGVDTTANPIIPGIMPITQFGQLARFSDMCGAEIPRWMRLKFESYYDDVASVKAFGHEVITDLCSQLVAGGVPGLHFYTMNRAEPTLAILKDL